MTMWVEKYRPKTFKEVAGQKMALEILSKYTEAFKSGKTSMPHFLFYGDTGIGKTTVAKIMLKEMFGGNYNWLDLNASDDRGIETVRNKIKAYARMAPIDQPFKIIFLDECDQMTLPAQFAMRRIMEDYSKTCRFILSCNYVTKIEKAIRGRCVEIAFEPLDDNAIRLKLTEIAKAENVKYTPAGLSALSTLTNGDLRKAVNTMHKIHIMDKTLDEEVVMAAIGFVPKAYVRKMLVIAKSDARTDIKMREMDKHMQKVYYKAFPFDKILSTLLEEIYLDESLSVKNRIKITARIGTIDYYIVVSANPLLQLRSFGMWLIQIIESDTGNQLEHIPENTGGNKNDADASNKNEISDSW